MRYIGAEQVQEVKLAETAAERDLIDSLAEIYSIIITLDGLEKHYTKDSISEDEYTDICNRLLKQYKSILKDETVEREFGDLEKFKHEWDVRSSAVLATARYTKCRSWRSLAPPSAFA